MSNTRDDATLARILCCGPLCGRPNPAEHGACAAAEYGARRLAALRAAGFDIADAAELLAFRARKGHAVEQAGEAEESRRQADMYWRVAKMLGAALELGITAREAQKRYFKHRTRENLIASKEAERAFDLAAPLALPSAFYTSGSEGQGST